MKGNPEERGFYTASVSALAEATGLSKRTIEGWGRDFAGRPDYVLNILAKENLLNQIRELNPPPNYLKDSQ
ncbi:unknown protein (plasmid) [Leptolyngbya sp. NIES-3755]|nr:unknown protein [Leptolyngbya sp. NIES-3755]